MTADTATRVREVAFAVPLLPGKTATDRDAMRSCWQGERADAYAAARTRAGITRESIWIQSTPAGDMAVVHIEAEDVDAAMREMGSSEDPFDRWFREHVLDVHGIDVAQPLPPLELVCDFRRE
ncbi:MAG TPA: hypothetical protein VM266_02460 [Solirubrobacteraceae bacterium]|nr:hypothetical protein [Solirubrobacteraceae bacterium]